MILGVRYRGVHIRTVANTPLDIPEDAEVEEMLNESEARGEARGELRLPMVTQICTEHSYKNARIRLVCQNDAEFLNVLMNCTTVLQVLNEVPTELQDWIDAINEWSHDHDEEDYIVFDENTPIGWLGVNGLLGENKKSYLKMAVFLPDYQGQGFGSFAIREVMCRLKRRGIKQIILYTDKDNYRAQACYKKCGFRIAESLVETMSNGKDVSRFKMETHWE